LGANREHFHSLWVKCLKRSASPRRRARPRAGYAYRSPRRSPLRAERARHAPAPDQGV